MNEERAKQEAVEFIEKKRKEDPNNKFMKAASEKYPTRKEVYKVYKKWLHVSDTKRLDILFAAVLTRNVPGTKIWIIIVGNSGDWKSEQIHALDDSERGLASTTKIIKNFTSKTLISGNPKVEPLALKLKDKIILIPEMAQLLKLPPVEKAEVWAQLRDLYDGYAGKQSGLGQDILIDNLNITLIGGSTPAIDSQILIHQDLGSRELIWRTSEADIVDDEEIMKKVIENENYEKEMRKEIKEVTQNYLRTLKYKNIEIKEKELEAIKVYVNYLRFMRAPAEIDHYTGDLLNPAHPEKPTRILKQFCRLFKALKSLDKEYSSKRALRVLEYLMYSASFQNRRKIFEYMLKHDKEEITVPKIAGIIKVGRKTAYKELNILWSTNLVKRRAVETENFGKIFETYYWIINDKNLFVKRLKELKYA